MAVLCPLAEEVLAQPSGRRKAPSARPVQGRRGADLAPRAISSLSLTEWEEVAELQNKPGGVG